MTTDNREPPIDAAEARELLTRARERLERELADLGGLRESELEEIAGDTDLVEEGEHLQEEEVDDAVASRLRSELEAVERAEKRLEEGNYGLSAESGEPIPRGRLEAIPWAERTEEEQERYERTHGTSG